MDTTHDEDAILQQASQIMEKRAIRYGVAVSSEAVFKLAEAHLAHLENERFSIMMLDTQHQVLGIEDLVEGTIDGAAIYPREIVKAVLKANAAAVIFMHNHPSGNTSPSAGDKAITKRLVEALCTIDVRCLDHIIVSGNRMNAPYSFAQNGDM